MLVAVFLPSLLLFLPSSLGETCNLQTKDTGVKEVREQLQEEFVMREKEMRKEMMTLMEVKIQELEKVIRHE